MNRHALFRQLPIALVVITAGIGIAQSATTGRVFPYVGYLEENGFPVDGERDIKINLYASVGAGTACQTEYFDAVTVANGRFKVDVEDVVDNCLIGGELYAAVSVGPVGGTLTDLTTGDGAGRVMIGAVPFAAASPKAATLLVESDADIGGDVTAGINFMGYVGHNGWAGFSHVNQATTTGYALLQDSAGQTLLNAQSGQPIRFRAANVDQMIMDSSGNLNLTSNLLDFDDYIGRHINLWSTDYGFGIQSNTLHAYLPNNASTRVGVGYMNGDTPVINTSLYSNGNVTVGKDLTVSGHVLGGYNTAFSFGTDYTASSDGFVVATIWADTNGDRGYLNGLVNGTTRAQDSVHYYTTSDVWVRDGTIMMPVRKGDTWRVNHGDTSGTCATSLSFVPLGVP